MVRLRILHITFRRFSSTMAAEANNGINARAVTGFAKASAYDKHRPSYGKVSVQNLLEQTRVAGKTGAKIIDLAAGTGKFTEILAAREEKFDILAVEPHDGMRDVLVEKKLSGVTVKSGRADKIDVPDESVDAVLIAQAFHWFANQDTLKELHRVLKPHGVLGLIWNIEDYNAPIKHKATTAWEQKLQDIIWSLDDNEPRFRHEKWRAVFDDQLKATPLSLIVASDPLFSLPIGDHQEPFEQWLPKEEIWARFNTLSQIATLDEKDHDQTYKTFKEAIDSPETTTHADGNVAVHGSTYASWTSKIPKDGRSTLTGVERTSA